MSDKSKEVFLTVFTPAYNRAKTLVRTYGSMCRQSNKNFKWLIVDDGSTDNTAELVKRWQAKDNGFEIQYIYKKNGGMHTAHNTAYENITTELNVCIDSDDYLADKAVEIIEKKWAEIRENEKYAGIIGLDADLDGRIIGTKFEEELIETTLGGFYDRGGNGDKKLVYRTDIMKKYPPYPEFEGEKYVGLNYKYILCDEEYKLFPINDILCYVEYQQDGSSSGMYRQYINNPKGWCFYRKFQMVHRKSTKRKFTECVHYVSSSIFARNMNFIKESPKPVMTVLAIPFGIVLNAYIRNRAKKGALKKL